jgi:hypothetical protein
MMKKILFFFLLPFQTLFSQINENDLIGLWEITQVTVGNEHKTPIAKWVDFKADHTHRGGNGWVQHSIGTWHFDQQKSTLNILTTNGIEDIYPPFTVSQNDNGMQWKREEDGQTVIVSLKKIEEIPVAYSDKMIGLWQVVSIENEDDNTLLPFTKDAKLFMRMDRRYSVHLPSGQKGGVWHAHAHRQQVRLLSDEGDSADTSWSVLFDGKKMVFEMKGVRLTLARTHHF